MPLPASAGSHHTAWVQPPHGAAHPLRYAVDAGRLVCFGDDVLADVGDGEHVTVTIHEIAGGPAVGGFGASVRQLPSTDVPDEALLELLAHVPLGRNLTEVEDRLAYQREHRRVVALVP